MPTLRDVAALAGVSVATVSNVINQTRRVSPATRARVEEAASVLGYLPTIGQPSAESALATNSPAGRSLAAPRTEQSTTSLPSTPPPVSPDGARDESDARTLSAAAPSGLSAVAPSGLRAAPPRNGSEFANSARAGRLLLRLLRAAQPISRVELARRLSVNRSTVTDTFKPLIAAGVVLEETPPPEVGAGRHLGRPPSSLSLNSRRDFFIGVSLGVKRSQVGAATLGGEILGEEDFETPSLPRDALRLISESIERLCAEVSEGRQLSGIGVSVPGPTDAERRRLLYAPHLGWQDVALADNLRFNAAGRKNRVDDDACVGVVVENNATAAAIYETRLRLRAADSGLLDNFVLVRSGTGIGVGLVLGGEVYRGTGTGEGLAGEFGHMTIVAGGKPCVCGNRGCWERYASASSASALYVGDRVQFGGASPPRYLDIVARAEGGELRARRTLERIGEYLGIGIGNVIMGLGVARVIVSGRVVYGWKFIGEPLRASVAQSMAGRLAEWSVEPGEPRGAGLGGALEVAVEAFLNSRLYV